MHHTRILIADVPKLLRDIVLDTVAAEPDLQVVGVVEHGTPIAPEVHRTGATVVILGARAGRPAAESACPADAGAPAVVVLTRDGRQAVLHLALGELSPRRLVDTLRRLPTMLDEPPADDARA